MSIQRALTPLVIVGNTLLLFHQHASASVVAAQSNSSEGGTGAYFDNTHNAHDEDVISGSIWERLTDFQDLTALDFVFLGCVIMLGLELNTHIVKALGEVTKRSIIPVRGKHLDDLSPTDLLFISLNKAATPPFVYCLYRYMHSQPNAIFALPNVTFTNTLLPIPAIIIIYDFFYTLLHWALHLQAIYPLIHKHHHRQKAPSRATIDAVNVHPIEFFLGEYNHLFAVYIYTKVFNCQLHIASILLLLIISAVLTGLNHSRYNSVLKLSVGKCYSLTLFDPKYHDVHHRLPRTNYGQYVVFWDKIFGTFRDYSEDDRVSELGQLDPLTGKTLKHGMELKEKTEEKKKKQ